MDVASYGAIISTIALGLSGFSIWLHWRTHVQEQGDRQPEVTWQTHGAPGLPGWTMLRIVVRNRADLAITAESIRVLWPLQARLADTRSAIVENAEEPWKPNSWREPDKTSRILPLNFTVAHAGKKPPRDGLAHYGQFDTHSTELLVSGRRNSWVRLRISFSASRSDFKISNSVIRAKIKAPAEPKITQQATEN